MEFDQLGPYRLGKKLGQGGMGAVYAGVETDSGAAAAIKVLSPVLAAEEGFRFRFESEIESLKKLRHPNIVRLLGYGEQAGTLFYAMELVEGTSLEDELRSGRRFDWREVTSIAVKLCRALKHAHDHGVIHRDLKPANLLLTGEGEIKLSDFGIARLFGNTRLTSDGGVLGTAEYMAPEQADGRVVSDRCDQYSLGGVMYALLAGRPPFRAKSLVEMLQLQRFAEPEPVTRYAPQTPAELARIIHQLLEKDPQKRFANALMLSRSLEAMERGLSISMSRSDDAVVDAAEPSAGIVSPLAPTLTPTQLAAGLASPPTNSAAAQATEVTHVFGEPPPGQAAEAAAQHDSSPGRFTKVEHQRSERHGDLRETLAGLVAPQTLALAAGLVVLLAAGWYLMQPLTADELYRRIETATASGDADGLRRAWPDIVTFLERHADDPRAETLRAMQEELKQAHPIERAFTEAKRYVLINPEVALARFAALIDVYDDGDANSETTRHYVRLARQQHARVQKIIDQYVDEGRKLVESRLAKAAEIQGENATAARKIYLGIIELYGEKPWAADLVEQAKTALNATPTGQATAHEPR
jgi:eukaryotic-like serine/threonine-protein kinase